MLQWIITGGLLPLLLVLTGSFFFLYLKGSPLRHPRRMWRALTRPSESGISPFRAMSQALAGTLGVGNIVGVTHAIVVGGAGAIFWMWVSALAAMLLKYAEVVLAVRHRRFDDEGNAYGGAPYYVKDCFSAHGLSRLGAAVAAAFALLLILNALGMGCVIQVEAVQHATEGVWRVSGAGCAALLLILFVPAYLTGSDGASRLCSYLMPLLTAVYLGMTLAVLMLRPDACGAALGAILREALHPRAAAGGVMGFLTSRALRVGTMRGLLSNEAGCGTAPTAHASARVRHAAEQGIFGILEVFVDTMLLCTATAVVVLSAFPSVAVYAEDPMLMSIKSYSQVLGTWSESVFCVSVLCFAYGTLLCWADYGRAALRFLSKSKIAEWGYAVTVIGAILLGALRPPRAIWEIVDFVITALTTVNLAVLLLMRREIREETLLSPWGVGSGRWEQKWKSAAVKKGKKMLQKSEKGIDKG